MTDRGNFFKCPALVSRLILWSLQSKINHMKSGFCKSDSNNMMRWFGKQFQSNLQMCLQCGRSGRAFCITPQILFTWMQWFDRNHRSQILTNVLRHIIKSAGHLSSSNVSRKACSHQSLRMVVKSTITAAGIIGMFIGLFCTRVCLTWQSLAPWLDSASVWIARWRISILPFVTHTDAFVMTTVSYADRSTPSDDVWTQHLHMTVWTLSLKYLTLETKQTCMQSEQGHVY